VWWASFSGVLAGQWRIVIPSALLLAVPLTVAVRRLKKPFIYAGIINLNTDEHGFTRIRRPSGFVNRFTRCVSGLNCVFIRGFSSSIAEFRFIAPAATLISTGLQPGVRGPAAAKPFQRLGFSACGKTVETVSGFHCQHHPAEAGC
jgi:hypothetical protein